MIRANRATILALGTTFLLSACIGKQKPTPLDEQTRSIRDLNERALSSAAKGNHQDADKLLQEALRRASSLDSGDARILTLLNQSRLARRTGQPEQAEILVNQALDLAANSAWYSDTAQEKALQMIDANKLAEAEKWAENALENETSDLQGRRLNLLARIAMLRNQYQQAEEFAGKAMKLNDRSGLELEKANSLRIMGIIRTLDQQWQQAEELLKQALEIDKQQAEPAKIALDLEALAELARQMGDAEAAVDYSGRAALVRENIGR
jgi:tetratricopeptide (TPR) repeat protein